MNLVAIWTVGSGKNKKLPGTEFETDEATARTLVSIGAARLPDGITFSDAQPDSTGDGDDCDKFQQERERDGLIDELTQVEGVDRKVAVALIEADLGSIEILQTCDPEKLSKVKGISKALAKKIIDSANNDFE